MKRIPLPKADTVAQSISVGLLLSAFSHLLIFGRGVLFARALDPIELGKWALTITAIQLSAYVLMLGFPSGLGRYLERFRREGRARKLLAAVGGLVSLAAVVGVGIALTIPEQIGRLVYGDSANRMLVFALLFGILVSVFARLVRGMLHGLRLIRWDGVLELIFNVSFLALAVLFYLRWQPSAAANAWAFFTVMTLNGVLALICLLLALRTPTLTSSQGATEEKKPGLTSNVSLGLGGLFLFSFGIWIADSLETGTVAIDRFMLLHLGTGDPSFLLSQIGDYFLAGRLAKPLAMVAGLIGVALLPHAAHMWDSGKKEEAGKLVATTAKVSSLLMTTGGALVLLVHEPLFQFLFGRLPESAGTILPLVLAKSIFISLVFISRSFLLCCERAWHLAGVWLAALVVNIVLNLILIPQYGLLGALIATLAATGLAELTTMFISRQSGLPMTSGCWLAVFLPFGLLFTPMLLISLLIAIWMVTIRTDWILSASEKSQLIKAVVGRWPALSKLNNASDDQKPKVLILGGDIRMVLPVARSLGRQGIEIDIAWHDCEAAISWSRYVSNVHTLPFSGSTSWLAAVESLISQHDYQLVIPVTESAVVAVQKSRDELARLTRVYALSDEAFDIVFDKVKTQQLAESLGIPMPPAIVELTNNPELDWVNDTAYPIVIKPNTSASSSMKLVKNFVHVANDKHEAEQCIRDLAPHVSHVLVQQHISGHGVGINVLADDGEILFAFQHRRLHEFRGFGSSYRKSEPLSKHLLDAAAALIRQLRYSGVAMVEFRIDDATGNWAFLEVNGRFWGSLPLAVAAGADFPSSLYDLLINDQREFSAEYRPNVYCRNLSYDLPWMRRSLSGWEPGVTPEDQSRIGWTVNSVPTTRALADLVRLLTLRDHIDTFAWDDPAPLAGEVGSILYSKFAKIGKLLSRIVGVADQGRNTPRRLA